MIKPKKYSSSKACELIGDALCWINEGHRVALLTLISIEGNGPYPIGTQMLVRDDGQYKGQITGGCVEASLVEQALTVINRGKNVTERYGLDSRFFDIKLPCGSGLDIEFDVETSLNEYAIIFEQLNNRKQVIASDVKTYRPTPRILLFGQGPIVECLIEIATISGFDVLFFDHSQTNDFTPYCDQSTGLISLFHEHDFEIDILAIAVKQPLFYIGALGSRKTHQARIKKINEKGISDKQIERIYGPIGLEINSRTPEQIAISIIAQLISVLNDKQP